MHPTRGLTSPNVEPFTGHGVEAVTKRKRTGTALLNTLGSVSRCLLVALALWTGSGSSFPGAHARDRIHGYPDGSLEMVESRTFDGRLQLLEYVPTVLNGSPCSGPT